MAKAHAAFDRTVRDDVRTLAGLFAAARELEQAYAEAGYALARVTVPPQRLTAQGKAQVLVIDGFVEDVDVTGVPVRARRAVARRLAGLIGKRRLRMGELERAVILAGEIGGVTLRSALAAGDAAGATRLVVTGTAERWQGRAGGDNRLPASLGRWQWNASLIGNGLFGRGEQTYIYLGAQSDIARHGLGRPGLGMVGGGTVVPLNGHGLTLGADVLVARTELDSRPGVPRTVGTFARAALSLGAAVQRSRTRSLDARLSVERIVQQNNAADFDTLLSRDRYAALRLGLTWREHGPRSLSSLALTLSRGIDGRSPTDLVPLSREGARGRFTSLQAQARMLRALPQGTAIDLQLRAQTSVGQPLYLSEQFALDAENAVSSFSGGSFNVDTGATLRGEFQFPSATVARTARLVPYVFAAGGVGLLARASAAEQRRQRADALGLGMRLDLGRSAGGPGLHLGLELGRGFSNRPDRAAGNRVNLTAAVRF